MKFAKAVFLLPLLAALHTPPVLAAALHYDEAVDGELDPPGFTKELTLGLGRNDVRGRITTIFQADGSILKPEDLDLDSFVLRLLPGQKVIGLDLSLRYSDETGNTLNYAAYWNVLAWRSGGLTEHCFVLEGSVSDCDGPAGGGPLFLPDEDAVEGYFVAQGSYHLWDDESLPSGAAYSYILSIDVASTVPAPSALLLSLPALGLALLARRRRAQARLTTA